jgi:hypothetical protein
MQWVIQGREKQKGWKMSHPLNNAADGLSLLQEVGIRLVPERPTRDMCRAGCAVGDVDPDTVRRIYNAMLTAAAECSLHGDNTLN